MRIQTGFVLEPVNARACDYFANHLSWTEVKVLPRLTVSYEILLWIAISINTSKCATEDDRVSLVYLESIGDGKMYLVSAVETLEENGIEGRINIFGSLKGEGEWHGWTQEQAAGELWRKVNLIREGASRPSVTCRLVFVTLCHPCTPFGVAEYAQISMCRGPHAWRFERRGWMTWWG